MPRAAKAKKNGHDDFQNTVDEALTDNKLSNGYVEKPKRGKNVEAPTKKRQEKPPPPKKRLNFVERHILAADSEITVPEAEKTVETADTAVSSQTSQSSQDIPIERQPHGRNIENLFDAGNLFEESSEEIEMKKNLQELVNAKIQTIMVHNGPTSYIDKGNKILDILLNQGRLGDESVQNQLADWIADVTSLVTSKSPQQNRNPKRSNDAPSTEGNSNM